MCKKKILKKKESQFLNLICISFLFYFCHSLLIIFIFFGLRTNAKDIQWKMFSPPVDYLLPRREGEKSEMSLCVTWFVLSYCVHCSDTLTVTSTGDPFMTMDLRPFPLLTLNTWPMYHLPDQDFKKT